MALQYILEKLGHGVPYNYDYPLRVNDFQYYITILFPIGLEVFSDSWIRRFWTFEIKFCGARGVGETSYSEDK